MTSNTMGITTASEYFGESPIVSTCPACEGTGLNKEWTYCEPCQGTGVIIEDSHPYVITDLRHAAGVEMVGS